jgi:hypothetical protein
MSSTLGVMGVLTASSTTEATAIGTAGTVVAGGLSVAKNIMASGRILTDKGADVASANDMTLGMDGNYFEISGTTQINRITTTTWQAGSFCIMKFAASVTVAHQGAATSGALARINLSGSANFGATANDTLTLVYNGTDWFEVCRTVI